MLKCPKNTMTKDYYDISKYYVLLPTKDDDMMRGHF